MNQNKDQNNRRSFVPVAAVYAGNPFVRNSVVGKLPDGNSWAGNSPGNQLEANPAAGNALARNQPVWNQMAGGRSATNGVARNSLAANLPVWNPGNQPVANLAAGNWPAAKQQVLSPVSGNSVAGNKTAANQLAGNTLVDNSKAANYFLGNPSASNSMLRKQPARNPVAQNQITENSFTRNSQIGNLYPLKTKPLLSHSLVGNPRTGSSQVSNYLTSTEKAGASMFSSSSNAGPTFHEDLSGMYTNLYRQPSIYDRKNTIYRQNMPDYGHSATPNYDTRNVYGRYSTPSSGVRKSDVVTTRQNTHDYQNYQQMGKTPPSYQTTQQSGYQGYAAYPGFLDQQQRRGYQASPGYQVGYSSTLQQRQQGIYPATSAKDVRDRVPVANNFKENNASNKSDQYADSPNYNTIPATTNTPISSQSLSTDNTVNESSRSGSGSGFDEPDDMENTADFQEQQELSGSGSGEEDGFMNPALLGGASDVAFMLAGANHKPPPFPAPGLPMNLTRQQAIDIYKSAMYFAGLMGNGKRKNQRSMRPRVKQK